MPKPLIVSNPALYSKEELIALFVVRNRKFERIFEEVKISMDNPKPKHWLIVGERGMGKTTMLHRIAYEIDNDSSLRDKIVKLIFPEEQYGIIKLFKLWELVANLLSKTDASKYGYLPAALDKQYSLSKNNEEYEEQAFKVVMQPIEREQKKLVLFIDNFGDMLASFSDAEKQHFREILMLYPHLKIIAGSAVVSESFYLYKDPLFESFKKERLGGLTTKEGKTLLLKLGEFYRNDKVKNIVKTQPHRIEVLRRLTGGNPRITILLFNMLLDSKNLDIYRDFITLLDGLTQFYNLKTSDFKGQRLEIVNTLALNWDGMSAKDIAVKMRESSSTVSSLIKQMGKDEVIDRIQTSTKNHLYNLKDRFYNIWYLMRNGYGDAQKALFLVKFLDEWLGNFERLDIAKTLIKEIRGGNYDPMATRWLGSALLQSDNAKFIKTDLTNAFAFIRDEQGNLIDNNFKDIGTATLKQHKDIFLYRLYNPLLTIDYNELQKNLYESSLSLETKTHILHSFEGFTQEKAEKLLAILQNEKSKLERYAQQTYAEKYKEYGHYNTILSMSQTLLDGENIELSILYLNKLNEGDYKISVAREQIADLYWQIAKKAVALGEEQEKIKQTSEALLYFNYAEESYLTSNRYGNNEIHFELGKLYEYKFKDFQKANQFYKEANKQKGNDDTIAILLHLGYSYWKLENIEETEKWFLEVLKIDENNADGFYWLGHFYSEDIINKKEKAEAYFLKAIELNSTKALNSLAWFYLTEGIKKEDALLNIKKYYQSDKSNEASHTYACILLWHNDFEESFEVAKRFLYDGQFLDDTNYNEFIQYLLLACAKKQYEFVDAYFTSEEGQNLKTKDRFRPIYFALMNLMYGEDSNEFLRAGSELKETIDEILLKISEMRIKYR